SLASSFLSFVPSAEIIDFPAWETLPHERLSPSAEVVGKRIAALRALREWDASSAEARPPLILVTSVRAALQPIVRNLADVAPVELTVGTRGADLATIASSLV